jgi:hypothetical protein
MRAVEIELAQLTSREWVAVLQVNWLGGRDSNPDNRVQSAVSYR